jgi:hypothetical protein
MPVNDENGGEQSYRSATAGEPKIRTAGKKPEALLRYWNIGVME